MQFQVTANSDNGGTMVTGVTADSKGKAVTEFFRILKLGGYSGHGITVSDVSIIPPKRYRER